MNSKIVTFKEGWPIIQDGISKIIHEIHTKNRTITEKDYMNIYTTSFNMCISSLVESKKLYERLNQVYEDYISFMVPCLEGKKDEFLLEEVAKLWENQKRMARFVSRFCRYLDRHYIPYNGLPTLQESSYIIFHKLVVIGVEVTDTFMRVIERQRNKSGENEIDQGLLKSVFEMYMEIGNIKNYRQNDHFNENILKETHNFYSAEALNWINSSDSYIDFMMKVEECMKNEKEKIAIYLQDWTRYELLKAVEYELMSVHAIRLEEMKQKEYGSYVLVEAMDRMEI